MPFGLFKYSGPETCRQKPSIAPHAKDERIPYASSSCAQAPQARRLWAMARPLLESTGHPHPTGLLQRKEKSTTAGQRTTGLCCTSTLSYAQNRRMLFLRNTAETLYCSTTSHCTVLDSTGHCTGKRKGRGPGGNRIGTETWTGYGSPSTTSTTCAGVGRKSKRERATVDVPGACRYHACGHRKPGSVGSRPGWSAQSWGPEGGLGLAPGKGAGGGGSLHSWGLVTRGGVFPPGGLVCVCVCVCCIIPHHYCNGVGGGM